jgi:hypothetical protein
VDHLAPLLADDGQLEERPCGLDAGLLLELAASCGEGIDRAPASRFRQKGPPGWTSRTSSSPLRRRYIRRPALEVFVMALAFYRSLVRAGLIC